MSLRGQTFKHFEVAVQMIEMMRLNNMNKRYKPVLYGVRRLGDIKIITLKIGENRQDKNNRIQT
jgi:ribosomal protein L23